MLVNATEMLHKARDGHYAVGQFNINNLEWTKAALQAAQEMNSPIILGAVSYTHLDVYKRQAVPVPSGTAAVKRACAIVLNAPRSPAGA